MWKKDEVMDLCDVFNENWRASTREKKCERERGSETVDETKYFSARGEQVTDLSRVPGEFMTPLSWRSENVAQPPPTGSGTTVRFEQPSNMGLGLGSSSVVAPRAWRSPAILEDFSESEAEEAYSELRGAVGGRKRQRSAEGARPKSRLGEANVADVATWRARVAEMDRKLDERRYRLENLAQGRPEEASVAFSKGLPEITGTFGAFSASHPREPVERVRDTERMDAGTNLSAANGNQARANAGPEPTATGGNVNERMLDFLMQQMAWLTNLVQGGEFGGNRRLPIDKWKVDKFDGTKEKWPRFMAKIEQY